MNGPSIALLPEIWRLVFIDGHDADESVTSYLMRRKRFVDRIESPVYERISGWFESSRVCHAWKAVIEDMVRDIYRRSTVPLLFYCSPWLLSRVCDLIPSLTVRLRGREDTLLDTVKQNLFTACTTLEMEYTPSHMPLAIELMRDYVESLPHLTSLSLYGNVVLDTSRFGRLTRLKYRPQITLAPFHLLSYANSLRVLEIDLQDMKSYDETNKWCSVIHSLIGLTTLRLARFRDMDTHDLFTPLIDLRNLSLHNSTIFRWTGFDCLDSRLVTLELQATEKLPASWLTTLTRLESLDIHKICYPNTMCLSQLTRLSIEDSDDDLSYGTLKQLTRLQRLKTYDVYHHHKDLLASYCSLTRLDLLSPASCPDIFDSLTHIQHIHYPIDRKSKTTRCHFDSRCKLLFPATNVETRLPSYS